MDAKIRQITDEIIKLAELIARETRETQGYIRNGDATTALRNADDHRDEVQDLMREYQKLTDELQRLKRL
jgi:protein involved in polysaccharide export with SLBB domain